MLYLISITLKNLSFSLRTMANFTAEVNLL